MCAPNREHSETQSLPFKAANRRETRQPHSEAQTPNKSRTVSGSPETGYNGAFCVFGWFTMQVRFGLSHPPMPSGSAVTIGNFDGVHLGHLHILQRLSSEARQRGLLRCAVVFEPQPNEFFAKEYGKEPPFRLTPLRSKLSLLEQSGCLDAVWVLRFNHPFAALSAEQFIRTVLQEKLNTRYLLVGDDFRFGQNRSGNFELLQSQTAFAAERTPSILVSGSRASSTSVRLALNEGRIEDAAAILGHPYTLSGHVKHGRKLGRKLGVPTANIHLPQHRYAVKGIYAVSVSGSFGHSYGVASFGGNPTVSDGKKNHLEVHLFNHSERLYGQRLHVSFLHKLRDEEKFAGLTELQQQIERDIAAAQEWLARHSAPPASST